MFDTTKPVPLDGAAEAGGDQLAAGLTRLLKILDRLERLAVATADGCLALRPKAMARALNVGEHWLWAATKAGLIPHVKVGRVVLYPVESTRTWLATLATKAVRR